MLLVVMPGAPSSVLAPTEAKEQKAEIFGPKNLKCGPRGFSTRKTGEGGLTTTAVRRGGWTGVQTPKYIQIHQWLQPGSSLQQPF